MTSHLLTENMDHVRMKLFQFLFLKFGTRNWTQDLTPYQAGVAPLSYIPDPKFIFSIRFSVPWQWILFPGDTNVIAGQEYMASHTIPRYTCWFFPKLHWKSSVHQKNFFPHQVLWLYPAWSCLPGFALCLPQIVQQQVVVCGKPPLAVGWNSDSQGPAALSEGWHTLKLMWTGTCRIDQLSSAVTTLRIQQKEPCTLGGSQIGVHS